MQTIEDDIRSLGRLAATHELLARGHTQMSLRVAVSEHHIRRVRKGWYCLPELDLLTQRAARVGGRLTCVSTAVSLGLWVPYTRGLVHVAVSPSSCQLRSRDDFHKRLSGQHQPGVVVHWTDEDERGSRLSVETSVALKQVTSCQSAEFAFVVCESALHLRMIGRVDFARVIAGAPAAVARELLHAVPLSESGTESMFSFRMRHLGVQFRQQVEIGPDRVDFVIGERLVVEIDSIEHHDPTADCKRDARLSIRGYRVLRFMYSQVTGDWASVRDSVIAAMTRGDHLAA